MTQRDVHRDESGSAAPKVHRPYDFEMETASGAYLDLDRPDARRITLNSVARGLSQTCRYASQTSRFYSVAEHAYLVAQRLRALGCGAGVQLAGLHHDDAEAFIGDQTRPMKMWLRQHTTALQDLEAAVFAAVVEALDLAKLPFEYPEVKEADIWSLAVESWQLMPSKGDTWFTAGMWKPEDTADTPFIWTLGLAPEQARLQWLEQHETLQLEIAEAYR